MDLEIRAYPIRSNQMVIKRWIDVLGAAAGLLLLSPLFLLIALLIQLETPGKAFYRQKRVGMGGRCFWLLKFRTMHDNTEQELEKLLKGNSQAGLEYISYQKLPDDPRQTRIGRFLRRTSLDELPQLWNVLRGEMSLVGPRPFLPEQLSLYGSAYKHYIQLVPGMTGLWQVSGRNRLTFAERVFLDEVYAREWSVWLDLHILLLTPWAVLSLKGAY